MDERPLWAPWRIEYITAPKDDECIFCVASSSEEGQASQRVVDRGTHCVTLLNAYPYAPGHLMVAPRRHVGELGDLSQEDLLETMQLARRATAALQELMTPDGFNVGLNLGAVAGAGIADHLHMHVVPRWEGDTNFMPVLAGTHLIGQALDATRDALLEVFRRLP